MIIVAIVLLMVGLLTLLTATTLQSVGGVGVTFLCGAALMAGGLTFLIQQFNKEGRNGHAAMYRDLVAQGWNVQSNDVSWQDDTAQVGCLKLDVNQVAGTYRVTIPRSAKLGGGNIVLYPTKTEAIIKELCG